ncbi:MAG: FecR family protein [Spirochaetales bacterium]|nr:FecR family protein [Spirochaetales bacterium]
MISISSCFNRPVRRVIFFSVLFLFLALGTPSIAAEADRLVWIGAESQAEVSITSGTEEELNPEPGRLIAEGTRINSGDTVSLIRIEPQNTLLVLSPSTEIQILSLAGNRLESRTRISLQKGKLRITGTTQKEQPIILRTPRAVFRIHSADAGVQVLPDSEDGGAVRSGRVEMLNMETGERITLPPGTGATTGADIFQPQPLEDSELTAFFRDIPLPEKEIRENAVTEGPIGPANGQDTKIGKPETGQTEKKQLDWFDLSISGGGALITSSLYGSFSFGLTFTAEPFKAELLFPVRFSQRPFIPELWHRPKGNNEWSFGSDQTDPGAAVADAFIDLGLKVHRISWGRPGDLIYGHIGQLEGINLEPGLIVRNYRNTLDTPSIRRIGALGELNLDLIKVKLFTGDLTEPEVFAGRIAIAPVKDILPLAMGITLASDIDPAGDLDDERENSCGDPALLSGGLDLVLSLMDAPELSLSFYTAAGAQSVFLRDEVAGSGYSAGFNTDVLFFDNRLRSFGFSAGTFGTAGIFDWRLGYEMSKGIFKPGLFSPGYERLKTDYIANSLVPYLQNPGNKRYDRWEAGVLGEAGFSFFEDRFRIGLAYRFPFGIGEAGFRESDEDFAELEMTLKDTGEQTPAGSVFLRRRYFLSTILEEEAQLRSGTTIETNLFDSNTMIGSRIMIPAGQSFSFTLSAGTNVSIDDLDNPEPMVSLETTWTF